ncbi:16 kDa phloem protein 1-like isoform X2 [Silene latifolia]|uniref:16 kDa phloem protein 1-like isoform X2 n=1 Tax=Silene latifolia TaxID=37657 RepID=UPI003D7790B4
MAHGVLEILLVEAHGLPHADFLHKIDPYVLVYYKGQERKTTIATGQGGNPRWNKKLKFRAEYPGSGRDYKLTFKVMDHDTFTSDDFLGQTTIHVDDLLSLGVEKGSYDMRTTKYRLDAANGNYCGDIKIGVKFTCEAMVDDEDDDDDIGGWKDSNYE